MKKKLILLILSATLLTGCTPKTYGDIKDWSYLDGDTHVTYSQSPTGCYSDGSVSSDFRFNYWRDKACSRN